MNMKLLKTRVKGRVRFQYFRDGALFYACDDGWEFAVPLYETYNAQGGSPTFLAEDKGIVFMRWIRKSMDPKLSYEEKS